MITLGPLVHPSNYDLGYHVQSRRFVRLRRRRDGTIPEGCVRIIRFTRSRSRYVGSLADPYEKDGTLKAEFWTLHRML